MLRVGARFARIEPRRRMTAFARGLLAGLPRVNRWSITGMLGNSARGDAARCGGRSADLRCTATTARELKR